MNLPPHRKVEHTNSPWQQLVGGLQYTSKNQEIAALILLSLVFSVFGISYSTILPAFIQKVLHRGAEAYGWVNAATGLGAVTGAFFIAKRANHGRRGQLLVITNIAFPLILIAFSITSFYPASLLFAYGLGLGFMMQFTTINTLLQTRVEDAFRGRIMALYTITFFGFSPFGNLLIGFLGEKMPLGIAMTLFAVCSLILSRLVLRRTPQVQELH
jgi:MFS family permease